MDRRSALETLAGLGGIGLAGCLGGAGNGGDGGTDGSSAGNDGSDGEEGDGDRSDGGESTTGTGSTAGGGPTLESPAFADGDPIPTRYTCDGENVSPALSVAGVPPDGASLALVVDDPDAPGRTFTHWLLWGLPATTESIPEGVPTGETLSDLGGASQGTNDAGVVGYSGPCPPPSDGPHTYRFRLLALARPADIEPGADRAAFDDAVESVASTETVLYGTYDR